jgi:uncharacterized protein DUF3224
MTEHAEGTFDLDVWDEQPPYDDRDGTKIARVHVDKTFYGGLAGTSTTELITVHTAAGPASYVGIERFTGTLGAHRGSFVLHHNAAGDDGKPWMTWQIVQTSGTDELTGLRGEGQIIVAPNGTHTYTLDWDISGDISGDIASTATPN